MKLLVEITLKKIEGKNCDKDEVFAAVEDELGSYTLDVSPADADDSVYQVTKIEDASTPKENYFANRLAAVLKELEDIESDAEDGGFLAISHKTADARSDLESAQRAATQYDDGTLELPA